MIPMHQLCVFYCVEINYDHIRHMVSILWCLDLLTTATCATCRHPSYSVATYFGFRCIFVQLCSIKQVCLPGFSEICSISKTTQTWPLHYQSFFPSPNFCSRSYNRNCSVHHRHAVCTCNLPLQKKKNYLL